MYAIKEKEKQMPYMQTRAIGYYGHYGGIIAKIEASHPAHQHIPRFSYNKQINHNILFYASLSGTASFTPLLISPQPIRRQ